MANERYLIRRRIEIDAAHRVPDHRSKCFNIHGHRYVIEAECEGPVIEEGEQTGMVMDFGFLKDCMMEAIHDPCDHGLILYKDDPMLPTFMEHELGPTIKGIKLLTLAYVPTAENLARYWYNEVTKSILALFRSRIEVAPHLARVYVWETPNCVASYPA